ncbi:MAG: hypothetical protein MK132_24465 [Lentisphaerales bacterium]|nr:hypothetical protein [Lentisphaerales bacterium]
MLRIFIIIATIFLAGCNSHHEHATYNHSHNYTYVDQLTDFERKDLNSVFVMTNGRLQNKVSITDKDGYRSIMAKNVAKHSTGNGARGRNPKSRIKTIGSHSHQNLRRLRQNHFRMHLELL